MPLGFAKSILTTAAATAGTGHVAYRQTNALSTGNLKGHTIQNIDFPNNNDYSMVFWFRAKNADNDGDSDDWIDGVSGGTSGSNFLQVPHSSGTGSGELRLRYSMQDFGWQMNVRHNTNSYIDGRGKGNTATQAAHSFDGQWRCLMISLKSDHDEDGASNTDGDSAERNFQSVYVGDEDYTNMPAGHTRDTFISSNFTQGHMGYNDSSGFSTTMTTDFNIGPGFHRGPLWVYNSFINFNTQSERRKFFDPANTDGFVTPSTDGTTSAGAAQPNLYLYWNGSNLVNGGSDTVTITERTVGTGGSFPSIPASEGPGSGDTI